MSYLDDLSASIDARIAALVREIAALESARAALAQRRTSADTPRPRRQPSRGETSDRNGHAAPPVQRRAHPRARRAPVPPAQLSESVERALRGSPDGLSAVSIAKQIEAGYGQVLALLRDLESRGEVRRAGTRRTSLWRWVSEEELIAERAAELERLAAS